MEVKYSDGMVSPNNNNDSPVVKHYLYLVSFRKVEKGGPTLPIIA